MRLLEPFFFSCSQYIFTEGILHAIPSTAHHLSSSRVKIITFKIAPFKKNPPRPPGIVTVRPQFPGLGSCDRHFSVDTLQKTLHL